MPNEIVLTSQVCEALRQFSAVLQRLGTLNVQNVWRRCASSSGQCSLRQFVRVECHNISNGNREVLQYFSNVLFHSAANYAPLHQRNRCGTCRSLASKRARIRQDRRRNSRMSRSVITFSSLNTRMCSSISCSSSKSCSSSRFSCVWAGRWRSPRKARLPLMLRREMLMLDENMGDCGPTRARS